MTPPSKAGFAVFSFAWVWCILSPCRQLSGIASIWTDRGLIRHSWVTWLKLEQTLSAASARWLFPDFEVILNHPFCSWRKVDVPFPSQYVLSHPWIKVTFLVLPSHQNNEFCNHCRKKHARIPQKRWLASSSSWEGQWNATEVPCAECCLVKARVRNSKPLPGSFIERKTHSVVKRFLFWKHH